MPNIGGEEILVHYQGVDRLSVIFQNPLCHSIPFSTKQIAIMDKSDVYRAANFLIKERGAAAATHAAENLEWMLAHNDAESAADWQRILQAIADIEDAEAAVVQRDAETHCSAEAA